MEYYDEEEMGRGHSKYQLTKEKIVYLATRHDTDAVPVHSPKVTEESIISVVEQE